MVGFQIFMIGKFEFGNRLMILDIWCSVFEDIKLVSQISNQFRSDNLHLTIAVFVFFGTP